MEVKTFRDLQVWQKAHRLTLDIYKITRDFPGEERFGIVTQIRRSAVSISANIVEGFNRRTTKDYLHFINIADASLEETKYLLLLAYDLKYLVGKEYNDFSNNCDEIGRMIGGLEKKLISKI